MEDYGSGTRSPCSGPSNANFTPANLIHRFHNTSMYAWDATEQEMAHLQPQRYNLEQTYKTFTIAIQVVIFTGSLLGNGAVLWFTCRTGILKPVTCRLVRNLACSSVCVCLTCLPLDMALSADSLGCLRLRPLLFCKVIKFLQKLFCSAAILSFPAIAMDRYYCVLYPLERRMSDTTSRGLLVYIWTHSIVVSLPMFAISGVVDIYAVYTCAENQNVPSGHLAYTIIYNVTTIVLPLAVVFLFLALIRHALSASQKRKAVMAALRTPRCSTSIPYVSRREAQLLAMLLCSVLALLAFGAPYAALLVLHCLSGGHGNPPVPILLTAAWLPKLSLISTPLHILALVGPLRRSLLHALARIYRRSNAVEAESAVGGAGDVSHRTDLPAERGGLGCLLWERGGATGDSGRGARTCGLPGSPGVSPGASP
ncbi:hypothetical protein GJAV_G00107880 [Gymnothorax javanicus]|nr:hypothetical protein GJAV_G00107880 [Gymnothorax javanicus]